MKIKLLLVLLLISFIEVSGQIRLHSVDPGTSIVGIKNHGTTTVDVSNLWLSYNLNDVAINTLTVTQHPWGSNGQNSFVLPPDTFVLVSLPGWSGVTYSDMSLYNNNSFLDTTAMLDFFQYGSGGNGREAVAVAKGIWGAGDFLPYELDHTYAYIGTNQENGVAYWDSGVLSVTDEKMILSDIVLSPNPTSTSFQILSATPFQLRKVEIYTITGELVSTVTSNLEKINVQNLHSGLYLIKLYSENQQIVKKIMIN